MLLTYVTLFDSDGHTEKGVLEAVGADSNTELIWLVSEVLIRDGDLLNFGTSLCPQ